VLDPLLLAAKFSLWVLVVVLQWAWVSSRVADMKKAIIAIAIDEVGSCYLERPMAVVSLHRNSLMQAKLVRYWRKGC
jgi:hypothetical protein